MPACFTAVSARRAYQSSRCGTRAGRPNRLGEIAPRDHCSRRSPRPGGRVVPGRVMRYRTGVRHDGVVTRMMILPEPQPRIWERRDESRRSRGSEVQPKTPEPDALPPEPGARPFRRGSFRGLGLADPIAARNGCRAGRSRACARVATSRDGRDSGVAGRAPGTAFFTRSGAAADARAVIAGEREGSAVPGRWATSAWNLGGTVTRSPSESSPTAAQRSLQPQR